MSTKVDCVAAKSPLPQLATYSVITATRTFGDIAHTMSVAMATKTPSVYASPHRPAPHRAVTSDPVIIPKPVIEPMIPI